MMSCSESGECYGLACRMQPLTLQRSIIADTLKWSRLQSAKAREVLCADAVSVLCLHRLWSAFHNNLQYPFADCVRAPQPRVK
jgi:hypothetical protein